MALIKCQECGSEISDKAESCPSCGVKRPKKTGIVTWVIVIFIGLIVVNSINHGEKAQEPVAANPLPLVESPQIQAAKKTEATTKEATFQKAVVFVKMLKSSMRDPESFKIVSVGANDDGSVICAEYRAKNGFGGYAVERALSVNGKFSQRDAEFNKSCAHKNLNDLGHVEYAM